MAVKDFITKAEVEAKGYKVLDMFTLSTNAYANDIYRTCLFYDMGLGYIYMNTDPNTYTETISPSNRVMMHYTAWEAGCHAVTFSITNTTEFKLIGLDRNTSDNCDAILCVNGIEFPRVPLSANKRLGATLKPYILAELFNLDPDRIYTISIEYKTQTALAIDCILLDADGVIQPINYLGPYMDLDENAVRASSKYTHGTYTNVANDVMVKDSGDTRGLPTLRMDKLRVQHPFKLVSAKEFNVGGGALDGSATGNLGGIDTTTARLSSGLDYRFGIRGTKKMLIVGRPYVSYGSDMQVFIDGVFYNAFATVNQYDNSGGYYYFTHRAIMYEITLPDTGYHDIKIKCNGTDAFITGIAIDKAGIVYPYNKCATSNLYIPKKDGLYYYTGNSYELIPDKETYPGYGILTIPKLTSTAKIGLPGRHNKFILHAGDKLIKPRSTGITVKKFSDYTDIASIPAYTGTSYYTLAQAISNDGSAYIKTMEEVPLDTGFDVHDGTATTDYMGGYFYNRAYYDSDMYTIDGQYDSHSSAYGIMFAGCYNMSTDVRGAYPDTANVQNYVGYTQIPNYCVFRFKTTSTFVSIWNHAIVNTSKELSAVGYDIYVNGVRKVFETNIHPTLSFNSYSNYRFELFKIEGLQPDDVIEIRITSPKNDRFIHNFGVGIAAGSTYSHVVDRIPNFEIVSGFDVSTNYNNRDMMFKEMDTESLNKLISNIYTADSSITDLELVSSKDIDHAYILDSSGVVHTSNDLESDRMSIAGFDIASLELFINGHDISEYELYAILDSSNLQDVRKLYGTIEDKVYRFNDTNLVALKSNYLISEIQTSKYEEDVVPAVTGHGTGVLMEYTIPVRKYNITKAVII